MKNPEILRRKEELTYLKSQRSVYHSEWEELTKTFCPGTQSFMGKQSMPYKATDSFIDDWGMFFKQRLVSYIFGQAVNPGTKFVKFFPTLNKKLSPAEEIELDLINDRVLRVFSATRSRFSSSIQQVLDSSITFGPGVLFINNDLGHDITFKSIPLSQVYFAENDKSVPDTVYREFTFTARQIQMAFPNAILSESVLSALKTKQEQDFTVVHCIYPNPDSKSSRDKYISIYYEDMGETELDSQLLSHNPIVINRWTSHTGEKYGHGQGKLALKSIRKLSKTSEQNLLAQELSNRPPLMIANDGVIIPDSIDPGSIIIGMREMDGVPLIQPLQLSGGVQVGQYMYEQMKALVGNFFFADDIALPVDKTRRTLGEVNEIKGDQLRFLTPQIARLLDELFKPMAEIVLQLLIENGEMSDLQTDIIKYDLEPEFLGPITQLLKMEDVRAAQNFLQTVLPMVQIDPSIVDRIDFDMFIQDTRKGTGTPAYIVRSDEEVAKIQQAKAQQQQQQVQLQNALGASEVSKNLGAANKFNSMVE